jgi:Protein of unknown function (DUF3551)
MVKFITRLMLPAAAFTTALCLDVAVSRASYGNAPWCLVKTGDDIYLDCQYRTGQECMQAIAAGNRGSCNVNPNPLAAAPQPELRKRR